MHAGSFLFRKAIEHIKQLHPAPCRMELHVNRHNKAVKFYERMGMRKLREGDFEIGGGFYMNDYIMGAGNLIGFRPEYEMMMPMIFRSSASLFHTGNAASLRIHLGVVCQELRQTDVGQRVFQ